MTKFITTIQLQDADERDYVTLFEELKKQSFQDEKHAAKSKAWVGGQAVFSREGDLSILDVNNLISQGGNHDRKEIFFFRGEKQNRFLILIFGSAVAVLSKLYDRVKNLPLLLVFQ